MNNLVSFTEKAFGKDLPRSFLSAFESGIITKSFPSGSFLAFEEDACSYLPLVVSGMIRVYKTAESGKEITLYRIAPAEGCVLTASCILSDKSFPAFAVVETDSEIILVPAALFRKWMNEYQFFRDFVFSIFSTRLAAVIMTISGVAFDRVDARIADQLLRLQKQNGNDELHLTHQQLAGDVASSREVVSRALKALAKKGLIQPGRSSIRILDADGLEHYRRK